MKALWLKFLDWFSQRFGIGRSVIPREPVMVRPIGVVRNGVKLPKMDGWADVRSDILVLTRAVRAARFNDPFRDDLLRDPLVSRDRN